MFPYSVTLLALLSPAILAHPSAKIPFTTPTAENLGIATDPTNNEHGIFHDGGGGAFQNGYHVQLYADSFTTSEGFNFVHNSVAYFGYRDPGNPLSLYTFGMKGDAEHETFSTTPLGPQGNETSLTSNFAIWATAGLTPMKDGKTVVGVFPALNVGNDTTQELYSTMFQMEVVDPTTVAAGALPPFERLGTGRLFYPNEVGYGELAILATDDYLYLLGADVTGVKLARTPNTADTLADRNHYQYWNSLGQTWQSVPLDKGNVIGNIITWSSKDLSGNKIGPANGDLWYDEYHKTYVMVWGDSGIDGTFWYSAANDPTNLAGGWSDPVAIYTPPQLSECADTSSSWNYCGHSHPGWDTTGKTLLLSYSSCASYISFAKLTW